MSNPASSQSHSPKPQRPRWGEPDVLTDKQLQIAAKKASDAQMAAAVRLKEQRAESARKFNQSWDRFHSLDNLHPSWSRELSNHLKYFFAVYVRALLEVALGYAVRVMGGCIPHTESDKTNTHMRVSHTHYTASQAASAGGAIKSQQSWSMGRGVSLQSNVLEVSLAGQGQGGEGGGDGGLVGYPFTIPVPCLAYDVSSEKKALHGCYDSSLEDSTLANGILMLRHLESTMDGWRRAKSEYMSDPNHDGAAPGNPLIMTASSDWGKDQALSWCLVQQKLYEEFDDVLVLLKKCEAHVISNVASNAADFLEQFAPTLSGQMWEEGWGEEGLAEAWMGWVYTQATLVRHDHNIIAEKIATNKLEFAVVGEGEGSDNWGDWEYLVETMSEKSGPKATERMECLRSVNFACEPIEIRLSELERR
jgi:hypothetical protein